MAKPAVRIGMDVGGTNLRIGVFEGLHLLDEVRFQANYSLLCQQLPPAQAWQAILQVTAEALQPFMQRYQVLAVGVGFPGFIDPQTGVLARSPNLPGLCDVSLGRDLSAVLGLPVRVENDANAAAYGEYQLRGAPAGGLLYLGLGTGLGAGLVVHGHPWTGQHGYALEAGHLIVVPQGRLCGCGNRGCVEQYASATGLSRGYAERMAAAGNTLSVQTLTAHQIAVRAQAGDVHAQAVYAEAGTQLANALASILKIIDVGQVVLGGGVMAAWSLMAEAFAQRLDADLIPVLRGKITVTPADSQDIAGMLGAALLAGEVKA